LDRRNALRSMIALACAPAILKVEMIMPVKPIVIPSYGAHSFGNYTFEGYKDITLDWQENDYGIVIDASGHTDIEVIDFAQQYIRKHSGSGT